LNFAAISSRDGGITDASAVFAAAATFGDLCLMSACTCAAENASGFTTFASNKATARSSRASKASKAAF
jgi:hypothetical protein